MSPATPPEIALTDLPGHYIRRLHQISVGIFMQEIEPWGVTPVQYAALQTVRNQPGIDQRSLARQIALDTSTIGGVIDRLEARGLLQRNAVPGDRRVRQLTLTPAGQQLLADVIPAMRRVQQLILQPLDPEEQTRFMAMVERMVNTNNALSRAPSGPAAER